MLQRFPVNLSFLAFACVIFGFRSYQQAAPAVCGTVDGPFGEDRCLHLSFGGEVSSGKAFEKPLGGNLVFRLNPEPALYGWTIEVLPQQSPSANPAEFVWVVNPPYRSWNTRYLDTSYGMSAKEAVQIVTRDFSFVLTEQQYKQASDLVVKAIMSRPLTDETTRERMEKESQNAVSALLSFPVAKGRLSILESRLGNAAENEGPGSIEWLKFKVDLRVPCDFSLGDDSREVSINRTRCPATEHK